MFLRQDLTGAKSAEAFGQQMARYIPSLRRYAWALLKHDHAADPDDLVQECLMQAWEKREQFANGSDLRAWLFTILHNRYVSAVRRSVTRQKHQRLMQPAVEHGSLLAPVEMEISFEINSLQSALNNLPDEQRTIVLLIALEGLSYEQVAKVVQTPVGTVRSRLSRARETLRKSMDSTDRAPA